MFGYNYFKYLINTILTILLLGAIISFLLYQKFINYEKEAIYEKHKDIAKFEFERNELLIKTTLNKYKDELQALNNIIKENNLLNKDLNILKSYMKLLIDSNNTIFQLRYINENADEIIRFDRDKTNKIIEIKKLQNKSHRDYFTKTKRLKEKQFFISDLDLNIEFKQIEVPYRPTIRVATPIYEKDVFKGILIINFNASTLVEKITKNEKFDVYYLDTLKNFLLHPDKNKSWSTQLKRNYKVENEIENIDELIKKPFLDKNQKYYSKKITITENSFYIILKVKEAYYKKAINKIKSDILSLFFIVALIGFPFVIIISYIQSSQTVLLDFIVNSIPHPFFIKDSKGKFIIVNDETIKFYNFKNKSQLIGANSYKIIDSSPLNCPNKDYLALKKGKLKTIEKIKKDENRNFYFEMIRVKIPYYGIFKKTYLLGIAIDITEIKELNEELNKKVEEEIGSRIKTEQILAQQSKMALMGEMIGNIAHQWRQPLSTITTASTGMQLQKEMGILQETELIKGLESINESAQYLSKTIDDFRNFFKPYKVHTNFTIEFIIDKSLKLVSAQFKNKDIKIIKNIENIELNNLENEFTQVILNILNNARDQLLKQNQEEKLIIINSQIVEENAVIIIKDNGGGIDEKIMDKIFEPYFTTKEENNGTGIGLYMSKEIIEKHMNGKLFATNEKFIYNKKEYNFAVFKIQLPIKKDKNETI
ncbi:ATP-binding protein [Malaciobacter mytili]|uniref:ATP-binding protein n=1 Tax=Malaciobacter mytili TaxID=603050 RepID=UPI0013E90650|nr:ATP-binding protein [Malaciobacter mytili]